MTLERTYRRLLAVYPCGTPPAVRGRDARRPARRRRFASAAADARRARPARRRRSRPRPARGDPLGRSSCGAMPPPRWACSPPSLLLALRPCGRIMLRPQLAECLEPRRVLHLVDPALPGTSWPLIVGWTAVAVAAAAGRRRTAAAFAWAAAAVEVRTRSASDSIYELVARQRQRLLACGRSPSWPLAAFTVPAPRSGARRPRPAADVPAGGSRPARRPPHQRWPASSTRMMT